MEKIDYQRITMGNLLLSIIQDTWGNTSQIWMLSHALKVKKNFIYMSLTPFTTSLQSNLLLRLILFTFKLVMASSDVQCDKYRSHIYGEGEKDTVWRFGAPPNYDVVNKLFEEGRTQEWALGSVEEKVQRLVKTWEMELVHKVRPQDFKTVNAQVFTHSVNGTPGKTPQEIAQIGSYNHLLRTSLPPNLRPYDPSQYTVETAQTAFTTTFPRGFAIEVLEVYSGPPKITYKFRHWSFMEGPFQGHAPTGELVQFFGTSIFTVDKSGIIEKAEFFYDPNELIAQLIKGPAAVASEASTTGSGCPFFKKS